ncbi:hypothetical protein [Limnoglobus roseus]|uniref:Uncharacterized protein n=1 Tax=Limnoglobus roseus TaxID=2598579 RepID=A0A5C1A6D6_9BACT|nr:hypothetical protein [Limnoglobus roseus]QEL14799.1 hypothetical protein PX52LOC_01693 [Limnoglobus roseus]
MTEPNERITKLETNMDYVLTILGKREDYQNSVLVKLTTIELKQDQSLLYQKTCDTERSAHALRLSKVENDVGSSRTVWSVMFRLAGGVGGTAAFVVSVLGLLRHQ